MVELAALEKRYSASYRGFESLSLRHIKNSLGGVFYYFFHNDLVEILSYYSSMTPTIHALRAITGVYVQKLLALIGAVVGGILLVALVITVLLATQLSSWWWLLLVVLVPAALISLVIYIAVRALSNRLIPHRLDSDERRQIKAFSDKIFGVVEKTRTPLPLTAILVLKDVIRNRESGYLSALINDSKSLKGDFEQIRARYQVKS